MTIYNLIIYGIIMYAAGILVGRYVVPVNRKQKE